MEHLEIILKKIFEYSPIEYSKEFCNQDNWFWKHSWTKEQEQEFITWLANYMIANKDARQDLMRLPQKTKKRCRGFARYFTSVYGWKTIE